MKISNKISKNIFYFNNQTLNKMLALILFKVSNHPTNNKVFFLIL